MAFNTPVRKGQKGSGLEKMSSEKNLISKDHPFNFEEVVASTGLSYVWNLHHDDISFIPYEELKRNISDSYLSEKSVSG